MITGVFVFPSLARPAWLVLYCPPAFLQCSAPDSGVPKPEVSLKCPNPEMGGCQNYGPFWGTLTGVQKGTIILTATQMTLQCSTLSESLISFIDGAASENSSSALNRQRFPCSRRVRILLYQNYAPVWSFLQIWFGIDNTAQCLQKAHPDALGWSVLQKLDFARNQQLSQ